MKDKRAASRLSLAPTDIGEIRNLLRVYLVYRFAISLILTVMLITGWSDHWLGQLDPQLYGLTVVMYLILAIASISFCQCDPSTSEVEYLFAILADSLAFGVIILTSGGLQSGFGILLGVSIAFGGLGLSGRSALFAAAIATVTMLALSIYSTFSEIGRSIDYRHVGLLGIAYFGLALLAQQLSARAMASERLARKRGYDIASLTRLNEHVIQVTHSGVMVVDHDQHLTLVNDSARALLNIPENSDGMPLTQIAYPLHLKLSEWLANPFSQKAIVPGGPSGRDLQVGFHSLGDSDIQGTLILLDDTDWIVEQVQQMKLASLGRLTASIAHEIRNPLGAISHAAQLLGESENLDAADFRLSEIIEQNSRRVNEVIENILSLSRRTQPVPEQLALAPWLGKLRTEAVDSHRLSDEQIDFSIDPVDIELYVDKKQLTQILSSLVDNAVTHFSRDTKELRIHIDVSTDPQNGNTVIKVKDNGPGVPEEIVTKIFDPFFTTRHDGTGLGLYITRELCEANKIRLDYIPGESGGSCFMLGISGRNTVLI